MENGACNRRSRAAGGRLEPRPLNPEDDAGGSSASGEARPVRRRTCERRARPPARAAHWRLSSATAAAAAEINSGGRSVCSSRTAAAARASSSLMQRCWPAARPGGIVRSGDPADDAAPAIEAPRVVVSIAERLRVGLAVFGGEPELDVGRAVREGVVPICCATDATLIGEYARLAHLPAGGARPRAGGRQMMWRIVCSLDGTLRSSARTSILASRDDRRSVPALAPAVVSGVWSSGQPGVPPEGGAVSHRFSRVRALVRERRLPPDERRAARAERQAEEQMRRERDKDDERARQLAAAEAERRRYSDGGRFR